MGRRVEATIEDLIADRSGFTAVATFDAFSHTAGGRLATQSGLRADSTDGPVWLGRIFRNWRQSWTMRDQVRACEARVSVQMSENRGEIL
jgi:hypothetical protein